MIVFFLLSNMFLQDNVVDSWVWIPNPPDGYTIKDAYHLISHTEQTRISFY